VKSQEILTVVMTSYYENVCWCKRHTIVFLAFCFWRFPLPHDILQTFCKKSINKLGKHSQHAKPSSHYSVNAIETKSTCSETINKVAPLMKPSLMRP